MGAGAVCHGSGPVSQSSNIRFCNSLIVSHFPVSRLSPCGIGPFASRLAAFCGLIRGLCGVADLAHLTTLSTTLCSSHASTSDTAIMTRAVRQ